MQVLLINGPNLNLLGNREPKIYGSISLDSLEESLKAQAEKEGIRLDCFQSNSEGDIVDRIHQSLGNVNGILINAGAYTHTSIALRDALLSVEIPYVELHMSNIYSREDFRQNSFISDKAIGLVSGFGVMSYTLAMEGLVSYLKGLDQED